jgi:hypothetical protein
MLDVKTIQSVRTARIEILHPVTGQPLEAYVTMLSSDAPARRTALLDYQRALRRIGEGDSEDQHAQRTAAHLQYISTCISDWEGISDDGQLVAFTPNAAVTLLQRPELDWLLNQITMHLVDSKNFIAAQPKVSLP